MTRHRLIVVGAGVLGAATAWQATRLGVEDVLVVDRGAPCSGTSPRGVGLVDLLVQDPVDVGLVQRSLEAFHALDDAAGPRFTFHDTGGVFITGPEHRREVGRLERLWRAQAVDVRTTDPHHLREIPGMDGLELAGDETVHVTEDDGWAVTTDAVNAMLDEVEVAGGDVRAHAPVDRVDDGQVHLREAERLEAEAVVVAAGVWTPPLLEHAWPVPLRAYRAQAVALSHGQPATPGPCVHDAVNHVYWRPEGPGKLLVGDGTDLSPHDVDNQPQPDADIAPRLKEALVERWPAAADASLVSAWAGLEAGTPDTRPLVGDVPGLDDVVVCAGGNGFGFMRASALGEAAARIALKRPVPFPTRPMHPDRFADPPTRFEMQEGFALGTDA